MSTDRQSGRDRTAAPGPMVLGGARPDGTPAPGALVLPPAGATTGVVVVLHGGKAMSHALSMPRHLASVRLAPFADALHAHGRAAGIAVWRVRYRYRGWNGDAMSPVSDAQWALDEVRRRHGDLPVVLVGHSMGGRTAVHVLGDRSVVRAVLLAPWLDPDSPVGGAQDRDVLVLHGRLDRWTSPHASAQWFQRAARVARSATYVDMAADAHFMFRRGRLWKQLTTGYALAGFGLNPSVRGRAAKVLAAAATGQSQLQV